MEIVSSCDYGNFYCFTGATDSPLAQCKWQAYACHLGCARRLWNSLKAMNEIFNTGNISMEESKLWCNTSQFCLVGNTFNSKISSLAPVKCSWNFECVIFKHIWVIGIWSIPGKFAFASSKIIQIWLREWLHAMGKHAVIWTNVDKVIQLIFCGLVTPYDNINLGQHWLR